MSDVDWAELRRELVRYATRRGAELADAEDAAQSVLAQLTTRGGRNVPSLATERTRVEPTYYKRMCLNAIRCEHRRRTRRQRRELASPNVGEPPLSPELLATQREEHARFFVAVSMMPKVLPPAVVQTFLLCDVQGLSAARAGRLLNLPLGTMKTRLRRARAYLTACLTPEIHLAFGGI
jgi:DNA-directed RNA polymerase specialized sigma24 family protein